MTAIQKILTAFIIFIFQYSFISAGGIMTNTSQSASHIRMPARSASTDLDAVYYNPAALGLMNDGLYISLNNQTIFQTRKIVNEFPSLNNAEYNGTAKAPFFPGFYAVYKLEKFAFSGGFMFVGGGGGATYKNGLPSFETGVSAIPSTLTGDGISTTDYKVETFFEGRSVFMGAQLGVSYQMFDFLGTYVGARYVMANNTYQGYFRNMVINPEHPANSSGGFMRASSFFEAIGDTELAAATADKEVDVIQSGRGFTPVIGFNYSPNEDLNIGLKYEFKTKLELENDTRIDDTQDFPDKEKTRQDMPAMVSLGLSYKVIPELTIALSGHYYFDRQASYGKVKERTPFPDLEPTFYKNTEIIKYNFFEAAIGIEYEVSDNAFLSIGYLRAQSGVNNKYQSDFNHSLSSNSIGFGSSYAISRRVKFNFGALLTFYDKYVNPVNYGQTIDGDILFNEKYNRFAVVFAIGVDVRLSR